VVTIKDMTTGTQVSVRRADVAAHVTSAADSRTPSPEPRHAKHS
jgi:hypothetical protein